jgi:hypothetical protein
MWDKAQQKSQNKEHSSESTEEHCFFKTKVALFKDWIQRGQILLAFSHAILTIFPCMLIWQVAEVMNLLQKEILCLKYQ